MISIFTKKETKVQENLRVVARQRIRERVRSHLAVLQQHHEPLDRDNAAIQFDITQAGTSGSSLPLDAAQYRGRADVCRRDTHHHRGILHIGDFLKAALAQKDQSGYFRTGSAADSRQ